MTDQRTTDPTTRPAALDQEYVVGGSFWWWRGQRARGLALPHAVDEIAQDFGDDIYDRLELDSQVAACDIGLRAAVLEDGITLTPEGLSMSYVPMVSCGACGAAEAPARLEA